MDVRAQIKNACIAAAALCLCAFSGPAFAQACPPGWAPAFDYDRAMYPFDNHCLALNQGLVHYVDESPEAEPLASVLLLHGNPTWSFLYREIVPLLIAEGFRVIAPDYFGFGLSDKPALQDFGYTPAEHAATMEALVVALDLRDIVIVGQDWGGPIGVAIAGNQFERMRAMLAMNTFFEPLDASEPGHNHLAVDFSLRNIREEASLRASGEFPRQIGIALGLLNASFGTPEFEAVRDAYWGPFLTPGSGFPLGPDVIAPTNIFAQNLLRSAGWMRSVDELLHAGLGGLPVYLLWGRADSLWGALQCNGSAPEACPYGLQCVDVDFESLCLEADGDEVFPQILHLQRVFPRGGLVGTTIADRGTHYVQEAEPGMIARVVFFLHEAAGARHGHKP